MQANSRVTHVLDVQGLTFQFAQSAVPILKDLGLHLNGGSLNVLYGPSGCGKSTLLKIIAGLYPEHGQGQAQGSLCLDDGQQQSFANRTMDRRIGYLDQNPADQFAMQTVDSEFVFALENCQVPPQEIDRRIDIALQQVDVLQLRDRLIQTLSGGELQKVALAIVLAMGSDYLLLDEPFASVDASSRQAFIATLKMLSQSGKTILLADHDLSDYGTSLDALYMMADQKLHQVDHPSQYQAAFNAEKLNKTFGLPHPAHSLFTCQDFGYAIGQRALLGPQDWQLPAGKLTLLTGANGSGKSTLLKVLAGLQPYQGHAQYLKREIARQRQRRYSRQVALVFQTSLMQFIRMTVAEELSLSARQGSHPQLWTPATIADCLTRLKMQGTVTQPVYQLSGGQQKKLQILVMLMMGTPVLLLDEPLAGLDLDSMQAVLLMIAHFAPAQHQTILMISHQLTGVLAFVDYHLQLQDKQLQYQEVL